MSGPACQLQTQSMVFGAGLLFDTVNGIFESVCWKIKWTQCTKLIGLCIDTHFQIQLDSDPITMF